MFVISSMNVMLHEVMCLFNDAVTCYDSIALVVD